MKTKKWTFAIKDGVMYMEERIYQDEVLALTKAKALSILKNNYKVHAKKIKLLKVQDVELYTEPTRNAVGYMGNSLAQLDELSDGES